MIKLDAYDKKILEILVNNSREQTTSIAKKVRLQRENVNYKIQRMKKAGLIKEFSIILDEKGLGLTHYAVFIELTNLKADSEKEILEYLEKSNYISWTGTAAGRWSLVFDVILHERIELDAVIRDLFDNFEKFIGDYVILRLYDAGYYNLKPLGIFRKTWERKKHKGKCKVDEKDLKILSTLNENARTNFVFVSEKVGLTPNGITKRVKNLEKCGIIKGYTTSIDWKKLDYEWYGIQLRLMKFSEEANQELIHFLREHKKIMFYYKYLGGAWDYDVGLLVKNSNELRDFINEFRTKFYSVVKISDVFLVLGEISWYKLPHGVFSTK